MNFAQGKCEIDNFQTGFVKQVLLITLTTRSVERPTLIVHKILVKNEKHAICIMLPSNKRVTMKPIFKTLKIDLFQIRMTFFTAKLYMNDIYSV